MTSNYADIVYCPGGWLLRDERGRLVHRRRFLGSYLRKKYQWYHSHAEEAAFCGTERPVCSRATRFADDSEREVPVCPELWNILSYPLYNPHRGARHGNSTSTVVCSEQLSTKTPDYNDERVGLKFLQECLNVKLNRIKERDREEARQDCLKAEDHLFLNM